MLKEIMVILGELQEKVGREDWEIFGTNGFGLCNERRENVKFKHSKWASNN